MFAIAYVRRALGRELIEVNPSFARTARDRGFYSDEPMSEIACSGGVRGNRRVPKAVSRAFVTALEIDPAWHIRMQAAVQRNVDAAVSKTINLPEAASVDDVRGVFIDAWRAGVKGITVYRYGSRPAQVLSFLGRRAPPVRVDTAYAGGCAAHTCDF
jgi:ribonucleoside-diphosphate reductase alpha chain